MAKIVVPPVATDHEAATSDGIQTPCYPLHQLEQTSRQPSWWLELSW
jgi:hypothetical protein